jgi:hypothetical protein
VLKIRGRDIQGSTGYMIGSETTVIYATLPRLAAQQRSWKLSGTVEYVEKTNRPTISILFR